MTDTPLDVAFESFAGVIMTITALRPKWTIYVITYGRPEKAEGEQLGISIMRFCAAVAAIGIATNLLFGWR